MDEIAKALKVSRASLYLLFKNKDGGFGDLSTLLQSDAYDEAKKVHKWRLQRIQPTRPDRRRAARQKQTFLEGGCRV